MGRRLVTRGSLRAGRYEDQEMATIIEDYCSAVRSSITNDGHPPLEASGLKLQENLILIELHVRTDGKKSALPPPLVNLKHLKALGLSATESLFSPVRVAYEGIRRDMCKMGHIVNFCKANCQKPWFTVVSTQYVIPWHTTHGTELPKTLVYRCFNLNLNLTIQMNTFPKKVIYGQV